VRAQATLAQQSGRNPRPKPQHSEHQSHNQRTESKFGTSKEEVPRERIAIRSGKNASLMTARTKMGFCLALGFFLLQLQDEEGGRGGRFLRGRFGLWELWVSRDMRDLLVSGSVILFLSPLSCPSPPLAYLHFCHY
jgi:hypothetical protein